MSVFVQHCHTMPLLWEVVQSCFTDPPLCCRDNGGEGSVFSPHLDYCSSFNKLKRLCCSPFTHYTGYTLSGQAPFALMKHLIDLCVFACKCADNPVLNLWTMAGMLPLLGRGSVRQTLAKKRSDYFILWGRENSERVGNRSFVYVQDFEKWNKHSAYCSIR